MLFTHNDTQDQQDNLIVILTPYIIEKSEKLSQLQRELGELSRLQREYNQEVFSKIEEKSKEESK
jgi:general secretion pathway protein D